MMPTFREWLLRQCERNDTIGDIARDYAADDCAERLVDFRSILRHIEDEHGAIDRARLALVRAYGEYRVLVPAVAP